MAQPVLPRKLRLKLQQGLSGYGGGGGGGDADDDGDDVDDGGDAQVLLLQFGLEC